MVRICVRLVSRDCFLVASPWLVAWWICCLEIRMKINCETHSFKSTALSLWMPELHTKYEPVVYDVCDCCGAKYPEGENIMYNDLMGMRLCEACWESLEWH